MTSTYTYTTTDIEAVVRRFTADLVMIAQSSGALTEATAREYAHDVEELATAGYLKAVDLTLFSGATEVQATTYVVDTNAGSLTMSRPGGVLWPRVANPRFRIVLSYTPDYDADARESMRGRLKLNWVPTTEDTSHASLALYGGRDYVSNGWGMQRKDYAV